MYNYKARSAKELSFKKGDVIQVFKRSNNDWWDGCLDGNDGFVPCAYVQLIDDDHADGSSSDLRNAPQSLPLDRDTSPDSETLPSPSPTRSTPTHVSTPTTATQSQLLLRHHGHKTSSPDVIPEDTHLSSFTRSSFKRSTSPSKSPSNSLERSRSLNDRASPKTTEDVTRTSSLPRSSVISGAWERRSQSVEPLSPAEARGVAEGMHSTDTGGGQPGKKRGPTQFTSAPPLAPKPKPKPKVPKRHSNPSTELIASLQAGTAARSARHDSHSEVCDQDDLPPPPPCEEREVVGGETPSPPASPMGKQDTFL